MPNGRYERVEPNGRCGHVELNDRYERVERAQYEHVELVDAHPNAQDDDGLLHGDGPMSVHDDAPNGPNDDRNGDDVDNGLVHS